MPSPPVVVFSRVSSLAILTVCLLASTSTAQMPGATGLIQMCPPGGESFATAWQLTCGMRRKRSAGFSDDDATSQMRSTEKRATNVNAVLSGRLKRAFGFGGGDVVKSTTTPAPAPAPAPVSQQQHPGVMPFGGRGLFQSPQQQNYRPLSMTEMMHFCCRYGCSFRDLLPYCDPFGTWDS